MKTKALALVLFVAGACASFALADDGHGKGKKDATATTAATTATTGAEPTTGKDKAHGAKKVTLCHKAGHSGRWVKISVSTHSARSHQRRGDVAPDASGNCPAAAAPTTEPATTEPATTDSTTTTNP